MSDPTGAVKHLTPDQVKALLASHRPGEVTLLDVRQDWEYAEDHIPAARHIPLPQLADRLGELDSAAPVVVYCASGRRSLAASAILAAKGLDVSNMQGGIGAWTGATAVGDAAVGMAELPLGRPVRAVLAHALALEGNLGRFYLTMADRHSQAELAATFIRLAGFEEKHKVLVRHLYEAMFPGETLAAETEMSQDVLEGGRTSGEVLASAVGLATPFDVLELAMGLEAQALDLYMRLAVAETEPKARRALQALAREEQGHLTALGNLMDKLG